MHYWDGMSGWGVVWMMLFGILLLGGLVLLVVVLVRAVGGGTRRDHATRPLPGQYPGPYPGHPAGPPASPPPGPDAGLLRAREILAERYARGEIDTEEYQARLRTLGES